VIIRVQKDDFDLGKELSAMRNGRVDIGALVSFSGLVRDLDGSLKSLNLEHYPGMTEAALTDIGEQAMTRWDLQDVLIIHRYGELAPGDQIMMVAAASKHRAEAFQAADFMMDFLKSRAPFWKKEEGASGSKWVDARDIDEDALSRWDAKS